MTPSVTPRVTEEFLCTQEKRKGRRFRCPTLDSKDGSRFLPSLPLSPSPQEVVSWGSLLNLITLPCSHRRAFQDWTESTPQNTQLSPDRRNSRQSSWYQGFPEKGPLMTWPICSLCPPTQKPTIDSYRDVGNNCRVLEPLSCSPKDRWCQLWEQSEKVE